MSAEKESSAGTRLCDCGCGRRFSSPPSAPHKRFASASCRYRWHGEQVKRAKEFLRQQAEAQLLGKEEGEK